MSDRTEEARAHLLDQMVAYAGMDWRMRWAAQRRLGWSLCRRVKDLVF